VLRRLAGALRSLGAADASAQEPKREAPSRQVPAPASDASSATARLRSRTPAAFLGALRRSREVIEMLERALTIRSRA
ncbi:MAG: hypothetical protein ACREOG_09455, partial [Gemmatimonadaceae bacterium]